MSIKPISGRVQPMLDKQKLCAAQSKIAIARFLGDTEMWREALDMYKSAVGITEHRKSGTAFLAVGE